MIYNILEMKAIGFGGNMRSLCLKLTAILLSLAIVLLFVSCDAMGVRISDGESLETSEKATELGSLSEEKATDSSTDNGQIETVAESQKADAWTELSSSVTNITTEPETEEQSTDIATETEMTEIEPPEPEIKNIIIIIGDGMGLDHIAAGQIGGQKQYSFTSWQSAVCNTDSVTGSGVGGVLTDSAAAATALATGVLTVNGYLGKDHNGENLKTILDYAKEVGKSVGIVTTDNPYGATPSGFSAHCTDRNDSKAITKTQLKSDVDLFLGLRSDTVYDDFLTGFATAGYFYSNSFYDMEYALTQEKVFMAVDIEIGGAECISLTEATQFAIEFLEDDTDGFVLVIEQAYIDKYSHSNDFAGMIERMDSLGSTVDAVIEWIGDRTDTAVIVTADHETGGLAVSASSTLSGVYQGSEAQVNYSWSTGNHTDSDVGLFVYGFSPDFSALEWYGSDHIVKNTDVFVLVKELLDKAETP